MKTGIELLIDDHGSIFPVEPTKFKGNRFSTMQKRAEKTISYIVFLKTREKSGKLPIVTCLLLPFHGN